VSKALLRNLIERDSIIATLLFGAMLWIFLASHVYQVADSSYSMLLSESLIHHHSFKLDDYSFPSAAPVLAGDYFKYGDIYQLEVVNGHIYYYFPPGSSILSVPIVEAMNLFGLSVSRADGTYDLNKEAVIEVRIAALLMAGLGVIFYFLARMALPKLLSLTVAVGGVLGTQVWSTASRSLWTDTWGLFLLGVVLLMLLGAAADRFRLRPILLATLLSWMYIVRPTFAVPIAAITLYMLVYYRAQFRRFAITGAVWLGAFMLYSWHLFGRPLPSYYRASRLQVDVFWTALTGNLISPGRGLLVFVPALFFVGYLLVRYRRWLVYPRLTWLSLAVILLHLTIISCFGHWWGGHSFGPRLSTGLVPWFVLLAILGLQARAQCRLESVSRLRFGMLELSLGAGLLFLSVAINGAGATSHATWAWNVRPLNIDEHPERNWDWRQPQFLAGLLRAPLPDEIPVANFDRIDFASPQSSGFLWYGWSVPDPTSAPTLRWTNAKEAAVVFRLNTIQDVTFSARLQAYVIPNSHREQRLDIALNGKPIEHWRFSDASPHELSFVLRSSLLREKNLLEFFLPDAVAPAALGDGKESRPLGIAVQWIQFTPGSSSRLARPGADGANQLALGLR
jgi:hypothetical protein